MTKQDKSFIPDAGLEHAIDLLRQPPFERVELPTSFSECGIGELETLNLLAPHVLGGATYLDSPNALAHMDPPTPWITWATTLWNSRLNQNLLHPATAPFAIKAERKVISWLAPFFGMNGGHMCSGSTVANLTALWAARDAKKIEKIVVSKASHISVEKTARILGLPYEQIATNSDGQIDPNKLGDISNACLVLTAGTTATGVIDSLELIGQAKWSHVDAAWGKKGISDRIDHAMSMATTLASKLSKEDRIFLWAAPTTGVTVFRPLTISTEEIYQRLPEGMFSTCVLDDEKWLQSVAANPLADIDGIVSAIQKAIR